MRAWSIGGLLNCLPLVAALLGGELAAGDATPPRCDPAPAGAQREIERLLASAAGHATLSNACVDGGGQLVTIKLERACMQPIHARPHLPGLAAAVSASYTITFQRELGLVRCTPMPDCAGKIKNDPEVSRASMDLDFIRAGDRQWQLARVTAIAGITLLTPLDRAHDTNCHGQVAPFVPQPFAPR